MLLENAEFEPVAVLLELLRGDYSTTSVEDVKTQLEEVIRSQEELVQDQISHFLHTLRDVMEDSQNLRYYLFFL